MNESYDIWIRDPHMDDDIYECLDIHKNMSFAKMLEEIVKLAEGNWQVEIIRFDGKDSKKILQGYTTMPKHKWSFGEFVSTKEY
jgi:hypothetical protein